MEEGMAEEPPAGPWRQSSVKCANAVLDERSHTRRRQPALVLRFTEPTFQIPGHAKKRIAIA